MKIARNWFFLMIDCSVLKWYLVEPLQGWSFKIVKYLPRAVDLDHLELRSAYIMSCRE